MEIVKWLNDTIIWGIPMLVLMLGTGLYLTFRTRAVIFTRFGTVMANTLKTVFRKPKEIEVGTITPIQAVCTALAGTIGTGNIVGVAVAISVGGPGAIFWMWTSAVLGMVTKYAETTLALAYREKNAKGEYVGGPMYYISKGLGFPKLAYLFCLLTAFSSIGGGNIVQANAVAGSLKDAVSIPALATGLLLAFFVALVVVGGIKRIASVAEKLIPFMSLIYTGAAIFILIVQRSQIPSALATIFTDAFTGTAAVGGFTGASLMYAARIGVARGVFTNEAGLGSAPIAHSTANTDHPAAPRLLGGFRSLLRYDHHVHHHRFGDHHQRNLEGRLNRWHRNVQPGIQRCHSGRGIHHFHRHRPVRLRDHHRLVLLFRKSNRIHRRPKSHLCLSNLFHRLHRLWRSRDAGCRLGDF